MLEGMTQQEVADKIGWSRGKIADYALLENLCPNCWNIIVAHFTEKATMPTTNTATQPVAGATISEKLLRLLRPLTEYHQLKIIQGLISPVVWNEIVTAFLNTVTTQENTDVTTVVTFVTEGLLRNILPLIEGRFFCFLEYALLALIFVL